MQSEDNSPLPLITIITPTYNQGQFIEETIQSVLGQQYSALEHLVIDGGSTDETIDILKRFSHLRWVSERDRGQTHAVNKGFQMAKGEIVGWVNSDDTLLPGTFEVVINKFQSDPNCAVVFGDYHTVDEHGTILYSTLGFCGNYEEMIRWWDYTYAIHQPTVFVRKKVIDTVGSLDESFHYAMDYEWWLRVARHYQFHHIPQYLATYRMHRDAKTFAPLEENVYPDQLRASKKHWGHFWQPRYWRFKKSYQLYALRKPKKTLHNPALQDWHEGAGPR
jgi:glycosyltransferase involved in cell wall biosynthesis